MIGVNEVSFSNTFSIEKYSLYQFVEEDWYLAVPNHTLIELPQYKETILNEKDWKFSFRYGDKNHILFNEYETTFRKYSPKVQSSYLAVVQLVSI